MCVTYCAVCRRTVAVLEEQERAKRAKHQAACEFSGEYAFTPFVVEPLEIYHQMRPHSWLAWQNCMVSVIRL